MAGSIYIQAVSITPNPVNAGGKIKIGSNKGYPHITAPYGRLTGWREIDELGFIVRRFRQKAVAPFQ